MPTDQLFKDLLAAFFAQFLRLFVPDIAAALDLASLEQRSPEVFTALPLATALAALMKPGPGGRPTLKIALIRRVQTTRIDPARLSLIMNVIQSYLRLDPTEQQAFHDQLLAEGDTIVEATELTWAEEFIQRGLEQGLEQGREQGALAAKRETALLQLHARFGDLGPAVEARIAAADDLALNHILASIVLAQSLEEVLAYI